MAPVSPRFTGRDTDGRRVTLGELDSHGVVVGWIDHNGLAWASCRERDYSLTSGAYADALKGWNSRDPEQAPCPFAYARAICVDPANVEGAAEAAVADAVFWERLRRSLGF